MTIERLSAGSGLQPYAPPERWDDWREYDPKEWPRRVEKRYSLVPTICFNCEAACGLLAYVDQETMQIRKFEGNPLHPASRGRNCAKGPATINQIQDPERILYPLKRAGRRGEGRWQRVTWDQVLDEIGGRIRKALLEGRRNEVMYHVGRPGHERTMDRVLKAWGIDGHNSHTTVCSGAARLGYALWSGYDRPSPDHANARFILLLSAHLEAGHYFNPHAQRILEGKQRGAKLAVFDPRLSNTASMADYWLPTYPGSEAAVLLAMAGVLLDEGLADLDYLERWTNWRQLLADRKAAAPEAAHGAPVSPALDHEPSFPRFLAAFGEHLGRFTPAFAEQESGVPARRIVEVARQIGAARGAFAAHVWRGAASGNLGGWQVARALQLLSVLTASVGTVGGTSPHAWNKYKPTFWEEPPGQKEWNELLFPREWPLSHYEMSFLLPHLLKEGRGKLDVYFTRVYNPVWTNPDGMIWMEVLADESLIGLHAALTPTWSETAAFADFVLPMGHAGERHDIQSQETQSGRWVSFRQPVLRAARERRGETFRFTWEANPGEVWEEDEFWIELSWRIDPDGALGIRRWFESPYSPGEKLTVHEYYRWIFENAVPGLPEAAARQGLAPLDFMRRYGAFLIESGVHGLQHKPVDVPATAERDATSGVVRDGGKVVGVEVDGEVVAGFPTPSRKLEIYSRTLVDWGWGDEALPGYIESHVSRRSMDAAKGEMVLVPTFRLPTLIHTRSGNAKYLNEISHRNPLWIHTGDAERLGIKTGALVRVATEIGYFVNHAWVTESIAPGVVACSHHLGRWRLHEDEGSRWSTVPVRFDRRPDGTILLRQLGGVEPFASTDPDSSRIWWSDGGVHQNLAFAVHPDPISGMHCWHQKVVVGLAPPEDQYGDVSVDPAKSMAVYRAWKEQTRPAPGPGGLRRPLWLDRPLRPAEEMFKI
jgi:anaerobic selenocysteine-containing dehydrogenase